MSEGTVPRGVSVGGVDIGGMSPNQAEVRLRNQLADEVKTPVDVTAGGLETTVDPVTSGLTVDWDATVDQAGEQPKNPITRVTSFWQTREVGTVSHFNDNLVNGAVRRVADDLSQDASNATLAINDQGKADIADDVDGQSVEQDAVDAAIRDNWLNTDHRVSVDADVTRAAVSREEADKVAREVVDKVTSGDLVFSGRDNVEGVLRPADMGRVVTFVPDGDSLRTDWNTEAAKEILTGQLGQTEVEFRNANFEVNGNDLTVIPSQDGVEIDWEKTLDKLQDKLLDTRERHHDVTYNDRKATYTTEMAEKATFDDVMGEFSTDGFASDSGVNIRRVAEQVNGAIVLPGETFSLNGYTGPRGEAQGYVDAGVIQDGHADTAVGGGISQFATTLYNASYFAGMEDVAHTAHSYYISRYPAGREATVYEGAIDLQFKNTFDTPVLIQASADSSSVSVKLRGVRHVDVESIPGAKTNYTDPERIELEGDKCSPSSGSRGFTTTDTRVVRDLSGREVSRNTTTTKYDPSPIVTCKK
ncbi:VanW family protein [Corynebacterium variabile]|uniref:VanW family protein n=1 Tax=Corynebacterium variabile TaxID=1727 RepID=UPI002898205C|nr:VanW family protein [Corynebacterium variabile]